MISESVIYFVILVAIGLVSVLLSCLALRKPEISGAMPFSALLIAIALWSFSYAAEFLFSDISLMLLTTKISFIGIVFLPVFWIWFVLEYTGRESFLQDFRWCLLFVIPALTLILLFTNEFHNLFYSAYYSVESGDIFYFRGIYGPWYIVHTIYSYVLLTIGSLFLLKVYFESPSYYRSRIAMVLFGVCIPWAGNFIHLAGVFPYMRFDITPFLFFLTGIVIYLGVFHLQYFGIMPVAKDTVVKIMTDCVFVIDKNNVIVDANPAAEKFAGISEGLPGKKLTDVLSGINYFSGEISVKAGTSERIELEKDGDTLYCKVIISSLFPGKKLKGCLVIIRDVTAEVKAEKEIYLTSERYRNLYNNISDGIILHRLSENGVFGKIIDANDVASKMLGYTPAELLETDGQKIQSPAIPEQSEERYLKLKESGFLKFETDFIRKDKSVFPVFISSRVMRLDDEDVIISLVKDISLEKESRILEKESLLRIEKNIEQFSILNDSIRNPLAVIVGLCSINDSKDSAIIIEESKKIDEIVTKLDNSCLESEKIRNYLLKHCNLTIYSGDE